MSWNYRIVRSAVDRTLSIHEVYYGPGYQNSGLSWSESPVSPHGETLEELQADFEMMARALSQPILREIIEGDTAHLEEEGQ